MPDRTTIYAFGHGAIATRPGPTPNPLSHATIEACLQGRADWCQGCGRTRLRSEMRWLVDVYRCRWCLGHGVGTPALWCDWGTSETIRG